MFGIPLHFLVVHFPIVLIAAALFYDLRGLHDIGYRLTLGAATAAVFAAMTGLMFAGGLPGVTVHAGAGLGAALTVVVLAVLRYSANARERAESSEVYLAVWLVLALVSAFGIAIAAITGHQSTLF